MEIYNFRNDSGNIKPIIEIIGDFSWAGLGLLFLTVGIAGFIEGLIEGVQKSV